MSTPRDQALRPSLYIDEDTFGAAVLHKPLADLLAQKRGGKKINHADLGYYLAALRAGQPRRKGVLVPAEIIDVVGEILLSGLGWAKACNEARKVKAAQEAQRWQRLADPIWAKRPRLHATRVADMIVPASTPERETVVGWVRRHIKRPGK